MQYFFVKQLCLLINALPRWLVNFLGQVIGRFVWYILPKKRKKIVLENIALRMGFKNNEATAEAKKCIEHFGHVALEFAQLRQIKKENINEYIVLEGAENLQKALSYGKGVILLTGHFGNWEWLAKAIIIQGFKLCPVVKKQHNLKMDRLINEVRKQSGMQVIYTYNTKEMLRVLQNNAILGLVADQDAGKNGIWINFLGEMASTPEGVAAFARMKGVPIVPAFAFAEKAGFYRGVIEPCFWAEKTANKEKDLIHTMQIATEYIEKAIKKAPYQWFWLHNRWKSKP